MENLRYPDTSLWSLRRRRADPLGFLEALSRRGDFVPFTLARRPAVLLNRPEHAAAVLMAHAQKFQKSSANQRAKHLLGNGLLTADQPLHAERRKLIQPAFARARLEECGPAIVAHARALCGRWSDGEVVDVIDAMGRLTFGVVGETIVGAPVGPLFEQVRDAVSAATASVDPLVSLVAPLRRVHVAHARLRAVVETVLARAASSAAESPSAEPSSVNASVAPSSVAPSSVAPSSVGRDFSRATSRGEALLSLLSPDPSPEQRLDDVLTILLAGHDTMTSALTWTWLLLASHPGVEARLREELASVLGARDAEAADVAKLVYVRAVLAESLRLYPPAWVLARQAVEAHHFEEGDVPAGTLVLVSQYLLHRDARHFDRSGAFEPERWLHGRQADQPRLAYFPFGAGPRSCIGESFAWMEGVLLLAAIAQRWKLRPVDAAFPEIEPRITLRPRPPVLMRVRSVRL